MKQTLPIFAVVAISAALIALPRCLLHQEPHVRELDYNQYADEAEDG